MDPSSLPSYKLTIDYGKNLKEMIAEGEYDYVNDSITAKNFPIESEGKQKVEAVLEEFKKMNLDPPNLETLLAFGTTELGFQRKFPIVALNPVWTDPYGDRCVVYLSGDGLDRGLGLDDFGGGWDDYCRFLALRRRSS